MILERYAAIIKDRLPLRRAVPSPEEAIREAVGWIYRAQDSSEDRGVGHSYMLGKGWAPSYPETTGYIIPTLLNWYRISGDKKARDRALQMAEWESEIQFPEGGVMASVVGRPDARPVVFNTGQVIFGWLAAYKETKDPKFLTASTRASRWLLENLGDDETWDSHGNMGEDLVHTYNVRTCWAVLEWVKLTKPQDDSRAKMEKVAAWTLRQERKRGWFDNNCLNDNNAPLLHTIAYTARGLLECGLLLEDQACLEAAQRTADALADRVQKNGSMAGRFDENWQEAASWSCLTGMAQMSIVWQKLYQTKNKDRYPAAARAVNLFLRSRQDTRNSNPGIRGGIAGSSPITGSYGKYRMLNWAAKFYLDAMIAEAYPDLSNGDTYDAG